METTDAYQESQNWLKKIYHNHAFFRKAEEILTRIEPDTYSMTAVDIEHFRLFNRLYGRESGNALLDYIAECLMKFGQKYDGLAGYIGGDNFCLLLPDREELFQELEEKLICGINRWNSTVGFLPAIGVYSIEDVTLPAVTMYDRATIALSHVAGNYFHRICRFRLDMEERLEQDLRLLAEIKEALERDEFTFYAQPQCDIFTGKIIGMESLIRWDRGEKGMVPPGIFIPVLERNGAIAEIDRVVWKKVCAWLKSWIDRGYHPVPVSVNVSRADIFSMDVAAYLRGLLGEYRLPARLLKVEITESAYVENNDKIVETVRQLREAGFLIMMDDFGSGYSSLNMLKSVEVDVLKLDMQFLDISEENEQKGRGILESVVNMARMLTLPVIVEGVETKQQEAILMEMGCRYVQGYYYYRPLSIPKLEDLLADERNLDFNGMRCKQVEQLHISEILDDNLFSETMINNLFGALAFYDVFENQIEITRVNEQYYRLAGETTGEEDSGRKFFDHVRQDDRSKLFAIFEQAYENPAAGGQGHVHYLRTDGKELWVYFRVFFLREKEGHKSFCSLLVDMTAEHGKEKLTGPVEENIPEVTELHKKSMEKYYGDMPYGFAVAKLLLDEEGKPDDYDLVYVNHELEALSGSSGERLRYLVLKVFEESKEVLLSKAYHAAYLGERVEFHEYSSISSRYLQLTMYQYEYGYVACILRDATHTHIYESSLRSMVLSCRAVYFIHLQDNYLRMLHPDDNNLMEYGNYEAAVHRHFEMGGIMKHNEENVRKFFSLDYLREILTEQDTVEYKYRRHSDEVEEEWCMANVSVIEREDGKPKTAVLVIRSIEDLLRGEEEERRQNIGGTLANLSDGFFIYRATGDEKVLYANPAVLRLYGCETIHEFRELTGGTFRGMVHPDDYNRIDWEIKDQIEHSDRKLDYIRYRIIRKDGEVRWIDDCGHLEDADSGPEGSLFYVIISDITDTITQVQMERLMNLNKHY